LDQLLAKRENRTGQDVVGQLLSHTKKGEDWKERLLVVIDHQIDHLQQNASCNEKKNRRQMACWQC